MHKEAIVISDLKKVYPNGLKALDGVSLNIAEGEVFGLIGPNGAGKTTALRIVSTLLKPTGGKVSIFGHDVVEDQMDVRKVISYLPEDAGAYENLTGREYLAFMAGFFGDDGEKTVNVGVGIADLGQRIDSKIKEYSKGMKRRLLIARALMTSPKLAIMDEPTSGLDVMHAYHVRKKIKSLIMGSGGTALLSSHNLLEVEFLCDEVALINKGKVIEKGPPPELKIRYNASNLEEVFMEAVRRA